MKKLGLTPLRILIHLGAWVPIALIVFDYFTGRMSVNPIQELEQRSGRLAVTFLVLTLACTPLWKVFGFRETIKHRRTLGRYTFLFAFIHVTTFFWLDYAFNTELILSEFLEKRYMQVGAITFILLSLLALTSFQFWMKLLKKNWKRLHRAIYVIAPLAVLHFGWARKGDLFRLQGDILRPVLTGVVVLLLLALRLPPVRNTVASWRTQLVGKFKRV